MLDLVDRDAIQEQSDELYKLLGVDKPDGSERWAMDRYTRDWFRDMNAKLRGSLVEPEDKRISINDIDRAISGVDSAMAKFELRTDTIVFRGDSARWYEGWDEGTEHELPAYVSTAVDDRGAKEYAGQVERRGQEPVMIEIRVPRGTMSIYIGSNTDVTLDYPEVDDEYELLLAHGLRYRVVERDYVGKRMVLEVVP